MEMAVSTNTSGNGKKKTNENTVMDSSEYNERLSRVVLTFKPS